MACDIGRCVMSDLLCRLSGGWANDTRITARRMAGNSDATPGLRLSKGGSIWVLVRLQDSHSLLKPAEILGFKGRPVFVVPPWSHPKNRSHTRTRTVAKGVQVGLIRSALRSTLSNRYGLADIV